MKVYRLENHFAFVSIGYLKKKNYLVLSKLPGPPWFTEEIVNGKLYFLYSELIPKRIIIIQ